MRCACVLAWAMIVTAAPHQAVWAAEVDFERQIVPLLAKRCLECHNDRDAEGGLSFASREAAFRGGDSGAVIASGEASHSLLVERVTSGEMPPESRGQSLRLPDDEIDLLKRWLDEGANWPADRQISLYEQTTDVRGGLDWWSLQSVERPTVPYVEKADWSQNPIDAFILAKLQRVGMEPAPPADRRTLIRRVYFDVIGLPPTPEQVTAFVENEAADAYERLIDELLDSPHYGERWARYWLDLVRFAETCGYERDQLKSEIWRYRDWVIDALNNDMPYDQFVTHQLAGDEVEDRSEQSVIATGMIRAGTWNDEPNDPADYLYERLEDMVHTTTSAFLGLTVKCARCHDHKFDPIRQTDYYRTASFFWAGYIGQDSLGGPTSEQLGYDVFGWTDKGADVEPIHLLIKGERLHPGDVVQPGFLSAVTELQAPLDAPPEGAQTTHRRLQLARWMTDRRNPLTARVFVNRLWLHHFGQGIVRTPNNFGFKGALPTHPQLLDWLASEFMDGNWSIKRIQKLILMSATYQQESRHPQQADYAEQDSQNQWLWRFDRHRLDAEALRDAMLSVSGELNPQLHGPSFFPAMSEEALEGLSRKGNAWSTSPDDQRSRRSIYMMSKRSQLLPLMTVFNFMDTTLPCGQRDVTTVPTQALALLNNQFVHSQSEALARRLMSEVGDDPLRQIERGWQLAFGRRPSQSESDVAVEHLRTQATHFAEQASSSESPGDPQQLALASLCHVLLNANEFLYVD